MKIAISSRNDDQNRKVIMPFSIALVNDPNLRFPDFDPKVASLGIIEIGPYKERFIAPLMYWSVDDYRRHWEQAIERILFHQSDVSCLITSMADPAKSAFIFWWPMYRVNNKTVCIQNHILFFDKLQSPFDESNPFSSVPERRTINEDGDNISEWLVSIDEVRHFWMKEYTTLAA